MEQAGKAIRNGRTNRGAHHRAAARSGRSTSSPRQGRCSRPPLRRSSSPRGWARPPSPRRSTAPPSWWWRTPRDSTIRREGRPARSTTSSRRRAGSRRDWVSPRLHRPIGRYAVAAAVALTGPLVLRPVTPSARSRPARGAAPRPVPSPRRAGLRQTPFSGAAGWNPTASTPSRRLPHAGCRRISSPRTRRSSPGALHALRASLGADPLRGRLPRGPLSAVRSTWAD
jgi:hypothetical protein